MNPRPLLSLHLQAPLDHFDLNLEVEIRERVTGIFGPSGSGKSTLLKCLCGMGPPSTGRIKFADTPWQSGDSRKALRPEKRGIGYVPQDHLLFPHFTVQQNLLAGQKRARQSGDPDSSLFHKVIQTLELEPLLPRKVPTLSGGERQRVALGRALCSGPNLLLLDEPLASLDHRLQRKILPFLVRIRENFDFPILLVSHNPAEILSICDEVLAIESGQITRRGKPIEVLTDPAIYRGIDEGSFENILQATIVEPARTRTEAVSKNGQRLHLPPVDLRIGDPVHLGISAADILVGLASPGQISARNRICAHIRTIRESGDKHLLVAALGHAKESDSLVVELTADAIDELRLEPDMPIVLFFKTSSLRVYA